MSFKYKNSITKIVCNEEVSTGFLVSENIVITTVHSIKEYLKNNENIIEVVLKSKSDNKNIIQATPILPKDKDYKNFEIIALKLERTITKLNYLECIKYNFENVESAFTFGYPAVRQNEGTLIELKVLGHGENGFIDLKADSDVIKDYQGCSGGPIIFKNYVVGILLEQVSENGEASRIYAVSLNKYEQYFREIGLELFEKASDIYQFNENLIACTQPKISLDFFDYEEKEFEDNFLEQLKEEKTIYLQGKTKEEVMGYALFIIKTRAREYIPKVIIVDGINKWNELKGKCEEKIIFSNFNAGEITIIPNNTNIIIFGEEDFIGNKKVLKLSKRILDNMRDKLTGEIDDITLAHQLVQQCNGFYSIFKRKVFEGKSGNPKWEEYIDLDLLPALFAGSWENNTKDITFIEELAGLSYDSYLDSIKSVTNGEDPFILHFNTGFNDVLKLANVEESWEIISSKINKSNLERFEKLALEVLSDSPDKYSLPIDEQYRSGLFIKDNLDYSSTLKKGIIRSLIVMSTSESENAIGNQRNVDNILNQLFNQVKELKQWFALAELLPLLVEASPNVVIDFFERELENSESGIWGLFENTGDGFFQKNYYTDVLWSLEKLLCLEDTAFKAIKILVKLSEREIHYKISNSPLSTLEQALSSWLHVINVSIIEKHEIVEYIVENSSIGWKVIEQILPDRTSNSSFLTMSRLQFRPYEFKHKLEYMDQIYETSKAYTLIAINAAEDDLTKWEFIIDKCLFVELGLYEKVKEKLIQVLSNNNSDEQKYVFKEKLRDVIYRHRFYKNSEWALSEENIGKIEELFNMIFFKNNSYNNLHLFTNEKLMDLNPIPYDENISVSWEKNRIELREVRAETLKKIIEDPNDSIWNLIDLIKKTNENFYSEQDIGDILASEIDKYNLNFNLLFEALENSADQLIISYIRTIYDKHGIEVIKNTLEYIIENAELVISILGIAYVDEEILEIVESFSCELKQRYWESFSTYYGRFDDKIIENVWSYLLKYKNYNALLSIVSSDYKKNVEKNIVLLEEILSNQDIFTINNHNNFLIIDLFKNIYKFSNPEIEKTINLRVCHLEFAYFNLIIDRFTPEFLIDKLKSNPTFLSELIQAAYKSETESDEADIDEKRIEIGKQAWNILYRLKFCPCVDENNEIKEENLDLWVKIFLEVVDRNGQARIGRQVLGECFAYSPINNDKVFPHPAVCKVFEKYYTDELAVGFQLGIINSRGVFTGSNGKQEESLADNYEKYARKTRIRYPKVSAELLKISEKYRKQAKDERERASYDF